MTSILTNKQGGPVFDGKGALRTITGNGEFRQRLVNVFSTQKYSETIFPEYGFDFISLSNNIDKIDKSIALRSVTVDALNPRNVYGLKELVSIDAQVTGTTGIVSLNILTDDGRKISENIRIGES